MKKINLINIFFLVLLNNFIFLNLYAQINNSIVAKVGDSLITTVDVQNEIITNLIMNKQIVTQLNIDKTKNFAIKRFGKANEICPFILLLASKHASYAPGTIIPIDGGKF